MTKENAFRMVEDFVAYNLCENWDGLKIRINKITYNVFLGYGTGLDGCLALHAWLSIPDFDTAAMMSNTYNQITDPDCAGTIIAGINAKNHYYVMEEIKEPVVLGWTRDEKGNVVDRHPVEVANAVTAAKRDNTQNYVITPINDQDGCSRTIKRQYQQTSRANLERQDALGATGATDGFRIRKLTPRECFRLMGVSDADIDKIQAAGISKSQQYKMAGNSIVVNCLAAIFRQLFIGNFNKVIQTEIF